MKSWRNLIKLTYMGLGSFFCDIGQVNIVFGQLKVEDHLPWGTVYQNLSLIRPLNIYLYPVWYFIQN